MRDKLGISERRACRVLGQHRSTQRHIPHGQEEEVRLVVDMIELARQYGRYGYRRIAALLRDAGWSVSDGRIERLRRREGQKVPMKQRELETLHVIHARFVMDEKPTRSCGGS